MKLTCEEALFALAIEKSIEKRAIFLDARCDGDPALRERLEALPAAHDQPESLLAKQAEAAIFAGSFWQDWHAPSWEEIENIEISDHQSKTP